MTIRQWTAYKIRQWTTYKLALNVDCIKIAGAKVFGYFHRDVLIKFKRWGFNHEYGMWFRLSSTWQGQYPQVEISLPLNLHFVRYPNGYARWRLTLKVLVFELSVEFWDYRTKVKTMGKGKS